VGVVHNSPAAVVSRLPNADPGVVSVVQSAREITTPVLVLLVLTAFLLAVLLRPFQISAVQLLEGYWRNRWGLRLLEPFAVETQIRKLDAAEPWIKHTASGPKNSGFGELATAIRAKGHLDRRAARARRLRDKYPLDRWTFLPTRLGNILRRGETTAGERYGLETMVVYPRLYPHLSTSVHGSVSTRLDLIDATCTFTILFAVQALLALPLVWRVDWWSLLPAAYLLLALVAYRGARSVAERFNETLYVAFHLHRRRSWWRTGNCRTFWPGRSRGRRQRVKHGTTSTAVNGSPGLRRRIPVRARQPVRVCPRRRRISRPVPLSCR